MSSRAVGAAVIVITATTTTTTGTTVAETAAGMRIKAKARERIVALVLSWVTMTPLPLRLVPALSSSRSYLKEFDVEKNRSALRCHLGYMGRCLLLKGGGPDGSP